MNSCEYALNTQIQLGHRHFARKGNSERLDNCGTPLQLNILLVTEILDTKYILVMIILNTCEDVLNTALDPAWAPSFRTQRQ